MVAGDYAWAVESYALGLNFCLTFVRGLSPDEVIARLGGGEPVPIVSDAVAFGGFEAVEQRVDERGATHPSGLDYGAVTPVGGWTMVVEPEGFLCSEDDAMRVLSSTGEMMSFYYSEHFDSAFAR
ncbi:DUF6461 domain-containing protein [Actinoplanes sp. CA-142083]|uniref:DUF6461 domain-containing protein n=1 Tax=Actinoplanes sp. CA-142083 TaxID=3239903 RepID=UPI003D91B169